MRGAAMWMGRRAGPGGLLVVLMAAGQNKAVSGQAQNFHFAHIDWKMCQDTMRNGEVVPGFHDPAFPEVCSSRQTPSAGRKVGFTIHSSWPTGAWDQLSMLEDYNRQIADFRDRCNGTLQYAPVRGMTRLCYLTVSQNGAEASPARMRKIGWLKHLGDKAIPPPGGGGFVVSAALNSRDFQAGRYNFVLERESRDFRLMHARFSFEIEFDEPNQYYSVYFEGCCRPSTLANNRALVFHVRTEVFVNSKHDPLFPMESFTFTHPPDMMLKREGPGACGQVYCRPNDCFTDYQLEGFHADPYWHERVRFRLGSVDEMGRYKCQGKQDPTNQDSAVVWVTGNCPAGHTSNSFTRPRTSLFSPSAHLRNDGGGTAGVVRFDMQQPEGEYHTAMVAEIQLPNGLKLAQVLDHKVRVADLSFNDQPESYMPDLIPEGDICVARKNGAELVNIFQDSCKTLQTPAGAPSLPIKQTAVEVQCGRPEFYLNSVGGRNRTGQNLGRSIEFAFNDPDFSRPGATTCQQYVGQTIDFIDSANMLPRGLTVSRTMHNSVNGVSKVQIAWTPVCEDRSQVGLFQLCFYAKDKAARNEGAFTPSYSVPSPYPATWQITSDSARAFHPTCIFLKSLPPASNARPVLGTDRKIPKSCCGTEAGQNSAPFPACAGSEVESDNKIKVGNEYVLGCSTIAGVPCDNYQLVVSAVSENDFFRTHIRFFYPDATNIQPFSVSGLKWGCTHEDFDTCVNNPLVTDRVAVKLTVTTRLITQNINRICYQAFQTSPPSVNEAAWLNLYKAEPTNKSCVTCFILNVVNAPVWPPEFLVPNNVPLNAPVGQTKQLKLTTRNLGSGKTNIFILADPGAPDGSHMTDMKSLGDGTFEKIFEYTPTVEQTGMQSTVCFTASTLQESTNKLIDSSVLCYEFYVYREIVNWVSDPCPFPRYQDACRAQGVEKATVGCTIVSKIEAKHNNHYDIKLRLQKYPECSNCYYVTDLSKRIGVVKCGDNVSDACCGDRKCNGAETGSGCPEDCDPDHVSLVPYGDSNSKAEFRFTPLRKQQGRNVLICVEATTDAGGTTVIDKKRTRDLAPSICMVFEIESCRYCVPPGATLKSIARHYMLNMDWLRLYNSNPGVANPDDLLPQQAIQVGPVYSVAPGDTLLSIAATMKTTVKMLMDHNPHLSESIDGIVIIKPDDKMCVLLCGAA